MKLAYNCVTPARKLRSISRKLVRNYVASRTIAFSIAIWFARYRTSARTQRALPFVFVFLTMPIGLSTRTFTTLQQYKTLVEGDVLIHM